MCIRDREYTIVFLERLGTVPPLQADSTRLYASPNKQATTGVAVSVVVAGRVPAMDSPLKGEAEVRLSDLERDADGQYVFMLDDLEAGEPYAVSVAMYNGVRSVYGLPAHATPASLTPAAAPSPPRTVAIKPLGEGSLNVTWTPPVDDGGARVTAYRVEWDSSEAVHRSSASSSRRRTSSAP